MYNLSPRKGLEITSGTSENVGPNTYYVHKCRHFFRNNCAPFLSSVPRTAQIKNHLDLLYDPPHIRTKIKYCNSLQFTASRDMGPIKKEPRIRHIKPDLAKLKPSKKNKGKIHVGPVRNTAHTTVPSVPSRIDANGYDISKNNTLIKMPPDELPQNIGPGYYNVPTGELNFNTRKYRGCAWSRSKSQRTTFKPLDNPGPARYHVSYNFCAKGEQDEQFRAIMRKCCNVPRVTCELICRAKKENLPGPGYYDIVDIDKIAKVQNLSMAPKPFNAAAERFVCEVSDVPGPQYYQRCESFRLKKNCSKIDAPFQCVAHRFQSVPSTTPGPGWYACATSGARPELYGVVKAPFDSNAPRKWTFLGGHLDTPGPADYCVKGVHCCMERGAREAYVFRSRTCRFRKMKCEYQPDATSYFVAEAHNVNKGKRSHCKVEVPFNSTEKKFSRAYDFAGAVPGVGNPGAGKYDIQKTICPRMGPHFDTTDRFKEMPETLGPGHYTLQPLVSESLYRAKTTHNSRLMKEVKRNYPAPCSPKAETKASSDKNLLRRSSRPAPTAPAWDPDEEYAYC